VVGVKSQELLEIAIAEKEKFEQEPTLEQAQKAIWAKNAADRAVRVEALRDGFGTPPPEETPAVDSVFVISYEENTGIDVPEREAAEKLLGKIVWFKLKPGTRPPQIGKWTKEVN
jgi:hypothetical protein